MKPQTEAEWKARQNGYQITARQRRAEALKGRDPYEVALTEHRDRIEARLAEATRTPDGCLVIMRGPHYARRVLQRPKLDGVGHSPLLLSRLVAVLHGKAALTDPVVRHHCDNPNCIDPEHLAGGTHKQNTLDMLDRGRAPDPQRLTGRPPKPLIDPQGRRWESADEAAAAEVCGPRGRPITADAIRRLCGRGAAGWRFA